MLNLAVVGATGAVGRQMLAILAERDFPADLVRVFASQRSAGQKIRYKNKDLVLETIQPGCWQGLDLVLLSAGSNISKQICPQIVQAGATAIDNSSAFRYENEIPLVIPEINPQQIKPGIIANPNCSTIQLLLALKPVYELAGLEQVVVSTYQAVSGSGYKAMQELEEQISSWQRNEELKTTVYEKQIAFNVVPQVDKFLENGYSREEMKMVWETHKILEDRDIKVTATAVRVPVFWGHSESVYVETKHHISVEQLRTALQAFTGVKVIDDINKNEFPTAIDSQNTDDVLVGRIRADLYKKNAFNMWVVGNNLRKGAALNAVQIAEIYREKYL
jgi:aspartate-semialdehyde dehydrogenase